MPLVIGHTVTLFETGRMTYPFLLVLFAVLIAIAVGSGVARFFQRMLMIGASRHFQYKLQNDYFRHVQRLSQDFFNRTKTGDIMARATNDLNHIRAFIGPGIMGTVDLVRVPITLAVMIYLSPYLTMLGLIPLPLMSLIVYAFVMYMHRQSKRVHEQFSAVTSRAQENLAGARVVRAYAIADREVRDFTKESHLYMREGLKLASVSALMWPLVEMLLSAIIVLVLWQGGRMVIYEIPTTRPVWEAGTVVWREVPLSLGDFSAFIMCLVMLAFPLTQFGWVLSLYQRGAVSMNRILEIMTERPTVKDAPDVRSDIASIEGAIRFENVTFGYGSTPVLLDITFDAQPGETIAIVGPTGSGKSTIVNLMLREYDPDHGAVYIDDVDIRKIPLSVLRNEIGYVPQDTFLFSDTIRENLCFGRPGATDKELDAACEVAQLMDTIRELPDGYDTLLGERGLNLSGGQKQRLTIARAVVRDPSILILDDALSSVDTHTEEAILSRLRQVMATRTSVIIAHRISTVKHADQILVVRDGAIVEQGTHDELLLLNGLYADMHQRQLLEEQLEDE